MLRLLTQQKNSAVVKGQMHHVESLPSVELSSSSAFDIDQQLFSNINLLSNPCSRPEQSFCPFHALYRTPASSQEPSGYWSRTRTTLPFVPANDPRLMRYRVFKGL